MRRWTEPRCPQCAAMRAARFATPSAGKPVVAGCTRPDQRSREPPPSDAGAFPFFGMRRPVAGVDRWPEAPVANVSASACVDPDDRFRAPSTEDRPSAAVGQPTLADSYLSTCRRSRSPAARQQQTAVGRRCTVERPLRPSCHPAAKGVAAAAAADGGDVSRIAGGKTSSLQPVRERHLQRTIPSGCAASRRTMLLSPRPRSTGASRPRDEVRADAVR